MRTKGEQKVAERGQQLYQPLAARMRPRNINELVGHEEILGEGKPLRVAIERGEVTSLILWGPPGVGKTTLAEIIARQMEASIERVSAVTAGVKDLRAVLERAALRQAQGKQTMLIVDEIHRFNKAQQDVLLPSVEEGLLTLVGATTENPYFEVVSALSSRAEIVKLEPLAGQDIVAIVRRAAKEQGVSKLSPAALALMAQAAGGDARRALNLLERVMLAASAGQDAITKQLVETVLSDAGQAYDKGGEQHYDTISAFIKSLRGSDADAALFYLFRMLAGGEDPKFIVRRMFIFASEDIGNADPHALMLVEAAARALEWVGLPEAEYTLAHATCYLAASPKSNSVTKAMAAAKEDVRRHGNARPPAHITNAPVAGMKRHGKGVGYQYPHDFPGHVVAQQYRPDIIQNNVYYEPGELGFEAQVRRRIEEARKILRNKE